MTIKTFAVWAITPLLVLVILVAIMLLELFPPYELGFHGVRAAIDARQPNQGGPTVAHCPVLPQDNVWNTPIDKLLKDQKSSSYIESIGIGRRLHADFGSDLRGGIPFTEVPIGTRSSPVTFDYREESDLGNYPIPERAPIEGGEASRGDRHVILVDPFRCLLYELYDAHRTGEGEWKAGSGVQVDLTSNALRTLGKTSADAAGLPILPGLVRYEEVSSGEIKHALRFTLPRTQGAFVWPARHRASDVTDTKTPPLGARFRLRADFDVSSYSAFDKVILVALKHYGMFLADNGGSIYISGVPDKRWNNRDLSQLSRVTAADFEAVDESNWQMLSDSGRVDPMTRLAN